MFAIYRLTKNFISKNILSELFTPYFITSQAGAMFLYFRDAANLSQNRGTVGNFNNPNFETQPKVYLFTYNTV